MSTSNSIALDLAGNAWILASKVFSNYDEYGNLTEWSTEQYCTVSSAGVTLSPPGGFDV